MGATGPPSGQFYTKALCSWRAMCVHGPAPCGLKKASQLWIPWYGIILELPSASLSKSFLAILAFGRRHMGCSGPVSEMQGSNAQGRSPEFTTSTYLAFSASGRACHPGRTARALGGRLQPLTLSQPLLSLGFRSHSCAVGCQ